MAACLSPPDDKYGVWRTPSSQGTHSQNGYSPDAFVMLTMYQRLKRSLPGAL